MRGNWGFIQHQNVVPFSQTVMSTWVGGKDWTGHRCSYRGGAHRGWISYQSHDSRLAQWSPLVLQLRRGMNNVYGDIRDLSPLSSRRYPDTMSVTRLVQDAYIQMVIRLAWYKSCGSFVATYETALTRTFDKSRRVTICIEDSCVWVLSMTDPFSSESVRYRLVTRFPGLIR